MSTLNNCTIYGNGLRDSKAQGFTLIEIMLAITLSMILIAGVVQIYLSSKTSFNVQNELARVQENERISIDFLQRDISQAGFNIPLSMNKITITEGANDTSDSITVRYASNTDCLGAATPNGIAVNRYFIGVNAQGVSNNQLMCLGNGSITPQPIANGVNNMQILVGEDSINNGSSTYAMQMRSADRYIKVGSLSSINQAASIRVALLIQSGGPVRDKITAQSFTLLDTVVNTNTRLKHQVVTTTIPLRN